MVNIKITVHWYATLCSLVDMYRCFVGTLASICGVEMSSTLMMEVAGVILLWICIPCLCFSLIFYMINIQGIIEFSIEFAIPFTQIYWFTYLYRISAHDMQRAYKSHIAVYSLMFLFLWKITVLRNWLLFFFLILMSLYSRN